MARKKGDLNKTLMAAGGGIAGGFVGNQLTGVIESGLIKANNTNAGTIAPLISTALGVALTMFAGDKLKPLGIGMSSVAGTETLESLVAKTTTTTTTQAARNYVPPMNTNAADERIQSATERVNKNNYTTKYD